MTRLLMLPLAAVLALAVGCSQDPGTDTGAAETQDAKVFTEAEFNTLVREADHPVLVDFTASWCPPCKRMKPILEAVDADRGDALTILPVDVDANPDLARQFSVQYLPTFILFNNGKPYEDLRYGMMPREDLEAWIDGLLAGDA